MTGFRDHFSGHADEYALHRPAYPEALADLLVRATPARRVAWDVGCGSGQLARLLADRFDHVVATDASGPQLAEAPRHPNVSYRRELADCSSLPTGVVDLIAVAQAAHWFDLDAFYREVRRTARSRAVVALVTYHLPKVTPEVDGVVHGLARDLSAHWPPERIHVDERYRSLAFPFEVLPEHELCMEATWSLDHIVAYIRTWSGVRRLLAAGGAAALEAAEAELERAWGAASLRPAGWPLRVALGKVP